MTYKKQINSVKYLLQLIKNPRPKQGVKLLILS